MRRWVWVQKRPPAGWVLLGLSLAGVSLVCSCLNPRPEDFPSADESATGSDTAVPPAGNPDAPGLGGDLLPDLDTEGNDGLSNDPITAPAVDQEQDTPRDLSGADAGVEPPRQEPDRADGGTSDGG